MAVESQTKLKRGDQAPDFNLLGTDGKNYRLDDFATYEGMLFIFMCNHCPYVKVKIEALKALHEKFASRIALIGINSNDPNYPDEGMENMKRYTAEWGISFPYLFDDTQKVARAYGAVCTPDPFLFDKDGKLVFHGRINNAMSPESAATEHTMEEVITKFLAGKTIADESKPSRGCSIKWLA